MCDAPFGAGRSDKRLIRLLLPPLEWDGLPGGRCMRDGGGEGMDSNSICLPYTQDRETGICQAPIFGLVLKKVARGAKRGRRRG